MFAEVISNPGGEIADIAGLAEVAHAAGIPLIIDATLTTPYLCRPIEHGADIVIHSATKFLGGHGTTLGGVVVESGRFDWGNGHFPQMTEPVPSYGGLTWWGNFQEFGFLTKLRAEQLRDIGASLSAHSAFLLIQGVETLPQRMEAHMAGRPRRRRVAGRRPAGVLRALGRPARSPAPRAGRATYLPLGPGAVFSFGVHGGREAGRAVHRVGAAVQPPGQRRRRPDPWSSIPAPRRTSSSPTTS